MKAKKLIAVLLAALVMAGALPAMAANENSIKDAFDAYSTSAKEGGWSGSGVLESEDGNKHVVIGNGNGDILKSKTLSGFTKDVTGVIANFSIKFSGAKDKEVIFGVGKPGNGYDAGSRMLQFCGNGKLTALNDAGKLTIPISYDIGVWYDVSVQINYDTGFYFVSISDGTQTKTHTFVDDRFKKDETAKAGVAYYTFWISDKNATEKVHIDNVDIFGTTDERIYPHVENAFTFESFSGTDGTTVPDGFTSESTLSAENGFFASNGNLKLLSGSEDVLDIEKTLDSAIKPANVQIKLGDAADGNFSVSISDSSGKSESINVENIVAGGLISLTVKGGKLMHVFSGDDTLSGSADTALTDVKEIKIASPEECESNFEIESIKVKTCTFPELVSFLGEAVKPDTNEIILTFSNEILESSEEFVLIGDREIENITFSGKSVKLTLDDKLSPNTEYKLSFKNLLDIEGNTFADNLTFKTDLAITVNSFVVESDDTENKLTANLVTNTGVNKTAKLILASFDKTTGKINESTDFLGIDITSLPYEHILKAPKTENETVEAYIWEDFYNMTSLSEKAKDMGKITLSKAEFNNDEYLTLCGKFEKGAEGDKVLLQIYNNDAQLETLKTVSNKTTLFGTIDYLREIELDEKGEFSIKVLLSGADKGLKNIKVSSCGNAMEFKDAFLHAVDDDIKAFLKKVNETETADTGFSGYICEMLDYIGEEDSEYQESDKQTKICRELLSIRNKVFDGSFKSCDEIKKAFNMAMLAVNVVSAENTDDVISLYGDKSILADESFFDYYNSNKEAVINEINKNLPESEDELFAYTLYNMMGETLILSAIKNVSTYTKIPDILNDNAEFLGLDLKDYNSLSDTSSIDKKLIDFDGTVKELSETIYNLVDKALEPESTPKPQRGGGGSVGTAVFNDEKKEESVEYFNDLASVLWAKESIDALAGLGIVSGSGKGKYEPMREVTREEFVKMAVAAFYRVDNTGEVIFDDIDEKDWSYAYVSTAFKKGFIKGINEREFGKGAPITREDAAVILSRIYGKSADVLLSYNDKDNISDYALPAVKTLTSLKVFAGNEEGLFSPQKTLTRAECAKVIYSLYTIVMGGE